MTRARKIVGWRVLTSMTTGFVGIDAVIAPRRMEAIVVHLVSGASEAFQCSRKIASTCTASSTVIISGGAEGNEPAAELA